MELDCDESLSHKDVSSLGTSRVSLVISFSKCLPRLGERMLAILTLKC